MSVFTSNDIIEGDLPDVRVGIGRGTQAGNVERSVEAMKGRDVKIYDDPEALVADLVSGKIDAAVRGDMSSSKLLPILKKGLGLRELERLVFLEPLCGKLFCLAPVGIDEGWNNKQRHDIAVRSAELMKSLGMGTKIAVMSGGRCEDYGRCQNVDRTIDDAVVLAERLRREGYDAYHSQILLEDAVRDADLIIAPEGITGNIIFRALHFIGGAKAMGAPVVNTDKVFIDTSRVKTDYTDSIALAMRLTEKIQ
jgi:putative methanogen marker protein 4